MRVSLPLHPIRSPIAGVSDISLLEPTAAVILGDDRSESFLPEPLQPRSTSLFAPRGACLTESGQFWVSDTGHHRLLGWRSMPQTDHQPADWVIGQPDFQREGQNAKGQPGRATVSVPTGICGCGNGLAVADAWNHRVLIWKEMPQDHNVPADLVLGQADFSQNQPNRGEQETRADRLHWSYGVFFQEGRLFVADTGNRRVLIWNQMPEENGQPADVVLGQADMTLRNENRGDSPTAASLRWGHSIAIWQGNLVVADAGNNRVMIWDGIPTENNTPCAAVLGQTNFEQVELNQGVYLPSATSLNMPYGVAALKDWLLVVDTANSRLLGWQSDGQPDLHSLTGRPADLLLGQPHFRSKGENRDYGLPQRDSFCWCYGIQICGDWVTIADSGNNRVLLWRTS
ncbi:hypothetical protein [Leptolyngbya ohadii]|uniref:hypothetical protein n=1 Tax=Leptolyngbya ohadii TaxID=1962290 RepID=UPI0011799471|nr:hypothetical protein [Leptolyngbya ohadii]